MSCRVFGRQLEEEALNILAEAARARGVSEIRAAFVPTEKNGVIADLFPRLGFAPDGRGALDALPRGARRAAPPAFAARRPRDRPMTDQESSAR